MRLDDVDLLVLALAEVRVDDDRAVVAGVNERRVVAVLLHRPDDALELPRGRRAAGEEEVPRDVDLERRVRVLREDVLVARQVHQRVVVPKNRGRRRAKDRDFRFGHVFQRSPRGTTARRGP